MTCGEAQTLTTGAKWFENAVLVEPRPDAFAEALEEFARSRSRLAQMGQAAKAFASSRYRKEALISNLDDLYRELLARKLPYTEIAAHSVSTKD